MSLASLNSRVFVLINISIFVSIALIHNRTAVKLVRIQQGDLNEFNFTFMRYSAFKTSLALWIRAQFFSSGPGKDPGNTKIL